MDSRDKCPSVDLLLNLHLLTDGHLSRHSLLEIMTKSSYQASAARESNSKIELKRRNFVDSKTSDPTHQV